MEKLSYKELAKKALAKQEEPIEKVSESDGAYFPVNNGVVSQYPFVCEQYVYVNPCTECKKTNPKPGHNCWKYS